MKQKIILCDVDNIVGDLCAAVLSVYNEDSGDNLQKHQITQYYIDNFVLPEYKKNFKNYFIDRRTWKRMKLVPDVQKYMAKLFNDGYRIVFVSKTECANVTKKERYLQRTFPFLDINKSFIRTYDKSLIKGDIMIDDCLDNLLTFDGALRVVLDCPWNNKGEDFDIENKLLRARDWQDIYNKINTTEKLTEIIGG